MPEGDRPPADRTGSTSSQLDPAGTQIEHAWDEATRDRAPDGEEVLERPAFAHPQWTVGVVLILAVVTLFLGVFGHPLWLLGGAPFILTLIVYIVVRSVEFRRRRRDRAG